MDSDLKDKEQLSPDADIHDPSRVHADALLGSGGGATAGGKDLSSNTGEKGFYNPEGDAVNASGLGGLESGVKGAALGGGAAGLAGAAAGGLFNPAVGPGGLLGRLNITRRKGITGTAIGLFLAGGVFLGFSAASGPLQFIHLGQLLQQFHLNEQSDESDDRFSRLTRFYRYAKTHKVEQTRLGVFANTYANKIETNLNKSGIISGYDGAGRFTGYTVDRNNENFKGKSEAQIKEYFKDSYGVNVTTTAASDGNKLTITPEKNGYFSFRKLTGGILADAGYKGVTGAVQARVLVKRAGLTLHPIKKLDNKVKLSVYDAVKARLKSDIENGATNEPATTKTADNPDDTDKTTAEDKAKEQAGASDLKDQTNSVVDDSSAALNDDPKANASIKTKLGIGAGSAVAGLGVACVIKHLNDGATEKKAQETTQLIRFGGQFQALSSQAQYGGQDNPTFLAQMGYYSQYLSGTQNGVPSTWTNSQSIQAEQGQKVTGVAPDSTLTSIVGGSPLGFINDIPGLGAACSTVGELLQGVFAFVTGPVSFGVGLVVNQAIQASGVLNTVIAWLAGNAVNLSVSAIAGAPFGNVADYTTKMLANSRCLSTGCRQLSNAESAQLSNQQEAETKSVFQNESFAYRLFSPDTPNSVVGSLIDAQNPVFASNVSQVASGFLNFGSALLSLPGKLFGGVGVASASAVTASNPTPGLPTYGFSEAELNDPNVANPYENADYVVQNLLSSDTIAKAQQCFGVTIAPDGSSVTANNEWSTNVYDSDAYNSSACSGVKTISFKGLNSNEAKAKAPPGTIVLADSPQSMEVEDEDWLRVRMFIFDSETADAASCSQGDGESCNNVGFDGGGSTDTATPTDGTVSGDAPTLAKQVLANANIKLSDSSKADIQAAANGQKAQPGPDGDGSSGADGRSNCQPVDLNPALLQVMLNIATKYQYQINDIVSGHQCDDAQHPKGRAMDIFDIAGQPLNDSWWSSDTNVATINDIGNIVHSIGTYQFGFGPGCSAVSKIQDRGNLVVFSDSCNPQDELHIDVRGAP